MRKERCDRKREEVGKGVLEHLTCDVRQCGFTLKNKLKLT
jgi:hypothetical protein